MVRGITTARVGAGRVGATRVAFTPKDTKGPTLGSAGAIYVYTRLVPSAGSYTAVKR